MHMAIETRRCTRADLANLPDDGNRYEVLDGELFVTPQARFDHQDIATRLVLALGGYVRQHSLGTVVAPGALVLGESELQPDVEVVPVPIRRSAGLTWESLPTPLLVIEILSRTTERRDLGKKRDAYLRTGILAYWVVDQRQSRVLMFDGASADAIVVTETLKWQPRTDVPPLEISIRSILPGAE